MKFLAVKLWGEELGRLIWNQSRRQCHFIFNPDVDNRPDVAPLLHPAGKWSSRMPVCGDDNPKYQGLPPFIADSLPDSWGNAVFDRWAKENHIPRSKVTPLYKLMFIGKRGMGALEYEPCAEDLNHLQAVDVRTLYDLSVEVLEEREAQLITPGRQLALQTLISVGTSAGGRQLKAIIAIDEQTGNIRSGQVDGLAGHEYYLLKFGSREMPMAEIEMAYYAMACDARITMEECRLFEVDGINHFLTKRFDRKSGKKVHMQTLAAINPEASSYEDLIATARELGCTEAEVEEIYRRLVFNVLANNTDDHTKNFSFLLEQGGQWHLSPAYDVTFVFNNYGTGPQLLRRMSVRGKCSDITEEDLMVFADENDIVNGQQVLDEVERVVEAFPEYSARYAVPAPWSQIIQTTLLRGCAAPGADNSDFTVKVNTKGYYEVTAIICGQRRRGFVRPAAPLYAYLQQLNVALISDEQKAHIVAELFK